MIWENIKYKNGYSIINRQNEVEKVKYKERKKYLTEN